MHCRALVPEFAVLIGAVYVNTARFIRFSATMFEGNSVREGFGGGLYVADTENVEVAGCFFASNTAIFGAAVATFSSGYATQPILYSSCNFSGNSAEEDGGAIYSVACFDDLRDIVMDDNFAGMLVVHAFPNIFHGVNPILSRVRFAMPFEA